MENNYKKQFTNGLKRAKEITRKYGKTFYFSSFSLPKEKKNAAYIIYAICRLSDDAVDLNLIQNKSQTLENLKNKINIVYSQENLEDNLLIAFRIIVNLYKIPKEYFFDLIKGMEMDLTINRYNDFENLKSYCYYVAGVVGLIMLKIFGKTNDKAKEYAIDLGIAMQLTNILRDIKEDYSLKRIYLPKKDMEKFNVTEEDIANSKITNNFSSLMQYQIKRARQYYTNAEKGIKMVSNWRSRLVIYAMKELYSQILNAIEEANYDVFSKRAHVNFKKNFH